MTLIYCSASVISPASLLWYLIRSLTDIFFLFYRHFVFFEHPPLVFMFSTKCLIFWFVSHTVTMLLDALLLRYLGDIRTHSPDPWCGWVFLLRLYWIQLLCVCNIRICLLTPFISVPLKLITRSHLSALFALIHSFHSQWESENCDLLSIFNVLSIHPFASAFHFQVLFNLLITLLNLLVLQETAFFCSSLCSSSSPALLLLKQHVIITGQRSLPAGVCVTTWQSICDQPEISCWLCTCSNIYSMFEVGVIVQS